MLNNVWVALGITFLAALVWLRFNDYLAQKGWLSGQVSRKIIHIGTGPIYVLCWLLFPERPAARFLAALVPLSFTAQFALIGLGIIKDEASVAAMSRTGDRREILRGPLYYGIIFVLLTIVYWRSSPIGIVALMLMCGGDGLADIMGKRFGRVHLPWSPKKSWIGSLGMLIGGWVFAMIVPGLYLATHMLPGRLDSFLLPVTIIAIVGMLVESMPFLDIDNITVTLAALIMGHILLP